MRSTKKPFKYFMMDCGTYGYDIGVCISEDRARVAKFVNKHFDNANSKGWLWTEDDFATSKGRFFRDPDHKRTPIIWMPRVPKDADTHGTINHEIFHAVATILRYFGIILSADSEEAYCHLIGYLTRQFYRKIK